MPHAYFGFRRTREASAAWALHRTPATRFNSVLFRSIRIDHRHTSPRPTAGCTSEMISGTPWTECIMYSNVLCVREEWCRPYPVRDDPALYRGRRMCQLTHSSASLYARVAPSLVACCPESTLSAASRLFATNTASAMQQSTPP